MISGSQKWRKAPVGPRANFEASNFTASRLLWNFDLGKNCAILKKLSVSRFPVCRMDGRVQAVWLRGNECAAGIRNRIGPATLVTLTNYAGRNFETESAVSQGPAVCGAQGTLGHRRKFSSEQGSGSKTRADRDFARTRLGSGGGRRDED